MTISEELAQKTFDELASPPGPKSRSRVWKSPEGYKFLIQWSNSVLLRILIRKQTLGLPKSEYRLKAQVDDAARSIIANIEEGWKRSTTEEYLRFLGFSQASLEEVKGDVGRLQQDGFLKSVKGSSLADLGIDLQAWNDWVKNPLSSSKVLYFPLKDSKGGYRNLDEIPESALTYEIFSELINKTDFLLRKLVESLETKLNQDKKYYKVEQARLNQKARGN